MKMNRTLLALAAAGGLAAPAAAFAQSGNDFSRMDANGDGTISQAEWNQSSGRRADNDWVVVTLTPVEVRVMGEQRREALFRAVDANGDGRVSAAEAGINTQLVRAFGKLDRDNNGMIGRQEFARVHVQDGSQVQASAGQAEQPDQAASAGGSTSRAERRERAIGAPPAIPDTPSSGMEPRTGPHYNPTSPH